jgi:hypothetical protein
MLSLMTSLDAVQGAAVPVEKLGLPISCAAAQLDAALTVHVKDAEPEAPVVSFAVTVTL